MTESKEGLGKTWNIVLGSLVGILFLLICLAPQLNGEEVRYFNPTVNSLLRIVVVGSVLALFYLMGKRKGLKLHWKIIVGLIVGVAFALFSSKLGWSQFTLDWIAPWGTVFVRLLKMIAVPMVLFSIIIGVVGLGDASKLGRMGIKTLVMYLVTTVLAVTVGLVVVNSIGPGRMMSEESRIENRIRYELWVEQTPGVEILDGKHLLEDPKYDAVEAKVRGVEEGTIDSKLASKMETHAAEKGKGPLQFVVDMIPQNIFQSVGNNKMMLQVIFFAVFFGIVMLLVPKTSSEPVVKVISGLNDIFVKMIHVAMQAAPFLVFALLAGTMSSMAGDDPGAVIEIFKGLGWYSVAVVIGLGFMIFGFYPTIAAWLAKIPYPRFFRGIGAAQTMAFSTSSSVATLPVTIDCVEKNLGVSKETSSFVLPIGATVNMDGTSLYQAVAVVFMAQMHMIELDIMQQLTIVFTASLASIGAAAVPSAGLILMMVVLESVGLNPMWIAIIFPVDRILDMCRTVVNVTGDATVSSVIAKTEGQLNLPYEGQPIEDNPAEQ